MPTTTSQRWYRALRVAEAAVERHRLGAERVGSALIGYLRYAGPAGFEEYLHSRGLIDAEAREALRVVGDVLELGDVPDEAATVLDTVPAEPEDGISVGERPSVLYTLTVLEPPMHPPEADAVSWQLRATSQADKYQTVRVLGRGGMGEVYEVRDVDLLRNVALKRVSVDRNQPEMLARFIEEAQISAQLEHPNIVPVYDIGTLESGDPFFTMKRIQGTTLSQVLSSLARGEAEATSTYHRSRMAFVFLQVVQAIAYAHARSVVHCDLKPGNIMLGSFGEVLVTDWGLARMVGQRDGTTDLPPVQVSVEGVLDTVFTAGTPPYMAPEQIRGDPVDPRTDVYALGVILYQILTLEQPYAARTPRALAREHETGLVPPRERAPHREIPEEIEQICTRAMALDPASRFQSADELAAAVDAYVSDAQRRVQAEEQYEHGEAAREELEALWRRRETIETEIAELSDRIKPYDGETKKAPLWSLEQALFENGLASEEALAEALDRYSQAISRDPTFVPPRDQLADLHLRLFLEAESKGDKRAEIFQRRQVERFHRGRHATVLEGRGLLTVRLDPQTSLRGWRLLERGKKIERAETLDLPDGSLENSSLSMGSYLFELSAPGKKTAQLPVHLGRGRKLELAPRLFDEDVVGADFVHVPAGPFIYGGDPVALNAGPRTEPQVEDFFIARFAVTCGQYLEFLNDVASRDANQAQKHVPRTKPDGGYLWEPDSAGRYAVTRFDADGNPMHVDAPVMGVSYFDAQAYCDWLSERDGVAYRLPSEVEWEKAARGADGRFFPWGNGFDPTFCKMALSRPGRPQPEPVGAFPIDVSVYGMRDCAGSIREWCESFYDASRETRVLRGGAWYFNPSYCRLAFRHGYLPHIVFTNFGFRLAKSP